MRPRQKQQTQKKSKRQAGRSQPPLTIHKGLALAPERLRVIMDHTSRIRIGNAGSLDSNYVLRPSSIYDVDPSIGGATCYGYTEYQPFYTSYRVYSSKIQLFCSNLEAEGQSVFVVASETSPGNNVADLSPYISHPRSKFLALGPYTGNAAGTLSAKCTTQAIAGVSTFAADEYTGQFGSNPANNWFWVIGTTKAGNTMAYGVDMIIKLQVVVDLFDRKVLQTGLSKLHTVPGSATTYPAPIPVYMVPQPSAVVVSASRGTDTEYKS